MTLKERIDRPISTNQIEAYFKGLTFSDNPFRVRFIEELATVNIGDLFKGNRTFEIFFIQNPNDEIGHFVSLIYRSENYVELFDPAGTEVTEKFVMPYLEEYIGPFADNNNVTVQFNRESFQSRYSSTCHRAVIFRCILSYLSIDEFSKVIDNKNFKNHDEFFATIIQY